MQWRPIKIKSWSLTCKCILLHQNIRHWLFFFSYVPINSCNYNYELQSVSYFLKDHHYVNWAIIYHYHCNEALEPKLHLFERSELGHSHVWISWNSVSITSNNSLRVCRNRCQCTSSSRSQSSFSTSAPTLTTNACHHHLREIEAKKNVEFNS